MLPDFFYLIHALLAVPTVHSLCVQVLPRCLFASEGELSCPPKEEEKKKKSPGPYSLKASLKVTVFISVLIKCLYNTLYVNSFHC